MANWVCLCVTDTNKKRSCQWNKTLPCLIIICEFLQANEVKEGSTPTSLQNSPHSTITSWFPAPQLKKIQLKAVINLASIRTPLEAKVSKCNAFHLEVSNKVQHIKYGRK